MNAFIKEYYGFEIQIGSYFTEVFKHEKALGFLEYLDRVKQDGEYSIDMHSFRGNKTISYSFYPLYIDSELVEILVYGRDITERIKTEQVIVKLNTSLEAQVNERTEELMQTVKTLRNFSMTVSHDLKVPVQEIIKYSKQIQNNINVEANSIKIIDLCSGMSSMISELLDYEQISGMQLKKEPVNIGKMISTVFDEYKTVSSILEFKTGIPKVYADKYLMRRVITNLLSNALKYSSKREIAKIIVGCRKEKNEYIFSIKDNGIGLDMKYASKLFTAFERLHNHDEYEGYGLGLASVRNIIAKHNGRTWITGKIDAGTTVYFTLPVETAE